MNDKTEIAFSKHIKRLEKDIAERAREWPEPRCGHHLALDKDDLKKIALLREGVVPKFSDLPVGEISGVNNLPEVDMFEFDNLKSLKNWA